MYTGEKKTSCKYDWKVHSGSCWDLGSEQFLFSPFIFLLGGKKRGSNLCICYQATWPCWPEIHPVLSGLIRSWVSKEWGRARSFPTCFHISGYLITKSRFLCAMPGRRGCLPSWKTPFLWEPSTLQWAPCMMVSSMPTPPVPNSHS